MGQWSQPPSPERLSGPLLRIGYSLGYYGHRDWWLRD
jgi:hypothetical protein